MLSTKYHIINCLLRVHYRNYQKAQEYIRRGMTQVANYYSEIANFHKQKYEYANSLAAASLMQVSWIKYTLFFWSCTSLYFFTVLWSSCWLSDRNLGRPVRCSFWLRDCRVRCRFPFLGRKKYTKPKIMQHQAVWVRFLDSVVDFAGVFFIWFFIGSLLTSRTKLVKNRENYFF